MVGGCWCLFPWEASQIFPLFHWLLQECFLQGALSICGELAEWPKWLLYRLILLNFFEICEGFQLQNYPGHTLFCMYTCSLDICLPKRQERNTPYNTHLHRNPAQKSKTDLKEHGHTWSTPFAPLNFKKRSTIWKCDYLADPGLNLQSFEKSCARIRSPNQYHRTKREQYFVKMFCLIKGIGLYWDSCKIAAMHTYNLLTNCQFSQHVAIILSWIF